MACVKESGRRFALEAGSQEKCSGKRELCGKAKVHARACYEK